jgi:DNA recombination protein RmuC
MLTDVTRLSERVGNLRTHFDRANRDIDQIEISAGKVQTRGTKIHELDLGEPAGETLAAAEEPPALPSQSIPED